MAIRGSLREASLPDVLQLLAMGQKTGCLSVSHRQYFGNVYFDRGRICYASIVNRRDRLGDILVKDGLITRAQLDAAIEHAGPPSRPPAGRAPRREAMSPSASSCTRYIKLQIEEAVYFLFTWTQGTFTFEADVRPDAQDILRLDQPGVPAARGRAARGRVEPDREEDPELRPHLRARSRAPRRKAASSSRRSRKRVVPLARRPARRGRRSSTTRASMTSRSARRSTGSSPPDSCTGWGRRAGRSTISTEARVLEHRNLGVAFYKTGMLDEAAREFRRVLELRATDDVARVLRRARGPAAGTSSTTAIRTFRSAAARPGTRGAAHLNLAYALERLGPVWRRRASSSREAERTHARATRTSRMAHGVHRAAPRATSRPR